jgi:hypothetical protein
MGPKPGTSLFMLHYIHMIMHTHIDTPEHLSKYRYSALVCSVVEAVTHIPTGTVIHSVAPPFPMNMYFYR